MSIERAGGEDWRRGEDGLKKEAVQERLQRSQECVSEKPPFSMEMVLLRSQICTGSSRAPFPVRRGIAFSARRGESEMGDQQAELSSILSRISSRCKVLFLDVKPF